jgi:hypothetical protein
LSFNPNSARPAPPRTANRGKQIGNFHIACFATETVCLRVGKKPSSKMPWDVHQHHLRMAVAEVFCALICIRRITMVDAIVISWVDVMKEVNRMYGRSAPPLGLERAMAVDHIGLARRAFTYAMRITRHGSDLVLNGFALCPKITIDVNERNNQTKSFAGLSKQGSCEISILRRCSSR